MGNPPSSLFENIRKLEQSEKMDEILGKWIFISQHGVEECLIKQNIGWIKRKLILSLAPNIIYSQPDENILRVEFQTKVKNMVRDYKWPGVTQHKDHDGDDVETETLLEDEKVTLICTGKP